MQVKKRYLRPKSCFSCPVACDHLFIVTEGPYAGTFGDDLFAPAMMYTSRVGNTDVDFMCKLAALSDQYGIDVMDMSSVMGYALECFETGILTASDFGGLKIEWGNTMALMELMEMVVSRMGIGDLLAEGATKASQVIGKGSQKYVMNVKGMSIDSRDPRGSKGWALGYAVAARGAEHCRYLSPDFIYPNTKVPEWLKKVFKGFRGFDRLSEEGKAEVYKWFEDMRAFQSCLALCIFMFKSPEAWPQVLAQMYNAVTGLSMSADEVTRAGERITNLDRAFNVREGLTRKDDALPDRFLKEPMPNGPSEGNVVNLAPMIDEYYALRGWEKETGYPTRVELERLGLKDVADELEKMGRLGRMSKGDKTNMSE
jgi:aldehyde:ferredoxin oxidoreductase